MKRLFLSLYLYIPSLLFAQQAPHSWKEYFSYNTVLQICEAENFIIGLSNNGIFLYSPTNETTQKLSKNNGLSSVGLTSMAYYKEEKKLIIGYEDGNIDIISFPQKKIQNISTITQRAIYGSKSIQKIYIHNSIAYLATAFGLVGFDMTKLEFMSTTIFGGEGENVPIYDIDINSATNTIYAASEHGIYLSELSKNISDISVWQKLQNHEHENKKTSHIAFFEGALHYVLEKNDEHAIDSIYRFAHNSIETYNIQIANVQQLDVIRNTLIITGLTDMYVIANNEIAFSIDNSFSDKEKNYTFAFQDSQSRYWIGDKKFGIINVEHKTTHYPHGPFMNAPSDLQFLNDKLYMTHGSTNKYFNGFVNILYGSTWYGHQNWSVRNTVCILPLKNSSTYYYGTHGWGLVQSSNFWSFDSIYNMSNSPIQNLYENDSKYQHISSLAADKSGNIWMLNRGVSKPLIVKTANSWYAYSIEGLSSEKWLNEILIDKNGTKWIAGDNSLVAFTEKGTLANSSDDVAVLIPLVDAEGIIADKTVCLAEDRTGALWIGTTQGIAIHSDPERVFIDRKSIKRPKIEINGETGYLLSQEKINAIAVDGANRKWVGTQNSGIFLISADGTEQLQNFRIENSPLPSNTIISIAIKQKTGEVFIATERGLVSYMSDATIGSFEMEQVYVFPNPVREDYQGDIYIQGTASDAIIKITDIAGNLVYQTIANGGTGVWNGTNLQGNKVSTGVYLIYVSDSEGLNTLVTKLAFVK